MTDEPVSLINTEDGLYAAPFPQFRRAEFTAISAPSILPVPPATDLRPGVTGEIIHGVYTLDPDRYLTTLELRDASNNLVSATEYDTLATAPNIRFTVPDTPDEGSYYLVVREGPIEFVNSDVQYLGPITVSEPDPILVLDTPRLVTGPTITTPGGSLVAGVLITCAGYDYDPDDAIVLFKWLRDGAETGVTTPTYLTTDNADGNHDLICKTYCEGYEDTTSALSNALAITTPVIVSPGFVPRSKFKVVETSTEGHNGTRNILVGVDAGGSAVVIPAGWTLYTVSTNGTPNLNTTPAANNTVPAGGSVTFARNTEYPVGTVVQHILGWRHDASNLRFYATDQADLVDVGGGQMLPYGAVKIVGVDPFTPVLPAIEALGDPVQGFIDVAVAAPNDIGANGSSTTTTGNADRMNGPPYANAILASAIGALKGHTDARTDVLRRIRYTINDGNRNPTLSGAALDRVNCMIMAACCLAKYDNALWTDLATDGTANRIDLAMKAAAIEGAFVSSDQCPGFTGPNASGNGVSGKPKTLTGYNATNLKKDSPNALLGPLMCYITMAYFGTPTAWLAYLNSVDQTAYDALRASLTAAGMTEVWTTLTWKDRGKTATSGERGGLSTDAPTDAQVLTAIHDPKWYGHPLAADYSHVMAMVTALPEAFNGGAWMSPAWITGTVRRGWTGSTGDGRGLGADSDGGGPLPAAKVTTGAVNGCQATASADPPPDGAPGGADSLYIATDTGPVSSIEVTVCAGRALLGAWLCMWVAELVNVRDPETAAAIQKLNWAWRDLKYKDGVGYSDYKGAAPSPSWPQTLDWQRHGTGLAFNAAQGGSLFETWPQVLGPALGCGPQVAKNGTFDSDTGWTGTGTGGKAITGGKLVLTAVAANSKVSQAIPFVAGAWVQIEYAISGYTAGSVRVALEGGTAVNGTVRSSGGTYKERLLVGANNGTLSIYPTVAATLSIDSVVVSGPWDKAAVDDETYPGDVIVTPDWPPADVTVTSRSALIAAIKAAAPGDIIDINLPSGGEILEMLMPNVDATAANPITIRGKDPDNPPIVRGINIGAGVNANYSHLTNDEEGKVVRGVVLENLYFHSTRYRSCQPSGSAPGGSLVMPDGDGLGWRINGTTHLAEGHTGDREGGGGMVGVAIGTNGNGYVAEDIIVRNCLFNGYALATQVSGGSVNRVTITQNDFRENVEDMFKMSSTNNVTYEWNDIRDLRRPTYDMAHRQGFNEKQEKPPHADAHQEQNACDNLTIRYNYMHDIFAAVHFGLLNNSGGPAKSNGMRVYNNHSEQSHTNIFWISYINGIEFHHNKTVDATQNRSLSNRFAEGISGTMDVHDNMAPKLGNSGDAWTGWGGSGLNNNENNNAGSFPAGFIQVKRENVTGGARFAGRWGNGKPGNVSVVVLDVPDGA